MATLRLLLILACAHAHNAFATLVKPNHTNHSNSSNVSHPPFVKELNARMATGAHGLYSGGKGVLMRAMFDGATKLNKTQVVSASLIVDDIRVPGVVFPSSG